MSAKTVSRDPNARAWMRGSTGSCLGCKHRKGSGAGCWCANKDLPPEQRPMGLAMRGCPSHAVANGPDLREQSMAVALGRIAVRRRDR